MSSAGHTHISINHLVCTKHCGSSLLSGLERRTQPRQAPRSYCAEMASARDTRDAQVPGQDVGAGGPQPKASAKPKAGPHSRRRASRPPIDLDDTIAAARTAAKAAAKALAQARTEARTERKRRARLVRKASQLSSEDLERIAVLKRTGFWDPTRCDAVVPGESTHPEASSSAAGCTARCDAVVPGAGSSPGSSSGAAGSGNTAPLHAAASAGETPVPSPHREEAEEPRREERSDDDEVRPIPAATPAEDEALH